mgnify:FL=1
MSVKKLASTTKRIEDWRAKYDMAVFEKSFQKWLVELERPEASWTIQDLIDSGADFTAQNPLTKETYRREPKNEMLVGYHAFTVLRGDYHILAQCRQLIQRDPKGCKEAMYLAAWCQWAMCRWPDNSPNSGLVSFNFYNVWNVYGTIIADADEGFIAELADLLRRPEYQCHSEKVMRSTGSVYFDMVLGRTEDDILRVQLEKNLADLERRKGTRRGWLAEMRVILDILDRDEEALDRDLREMIRCHRSNPDNHLCLYALAYAKTAMRRGLEVTVDTEDCPLSLSRPADMDYSGLELPRPKYGFPWERYEAEPPP